LRLFCFIATLTLMNEFTEQFKQEAAKHTNLKGVADAVGLPDQQDKERIQRYLARYDKAHPGEIQFHISMAREHFRAAGGAKQKYGLVNKAASGRTLFELPNEVGQWLEAAYPLMFRSKEHTAWFAKNFPELLIPERY
jgi:hypothetical protein